MPRQEHLMRQAEWKNTLEKYGCSVILEKTIRIKGAQIIADVYAETEGKTFLIEIGDIEDERKTALMQYHAEANSNIEFIHENYGENKMPQVLEFITAYRNSPEYKHLTHQKMIWEQQRRNAKIKDIRTKRHVLYSILFIWLVPAVALLFIDTATALGWFIGCPILIFGLPILLIFLGVFLGGQNWAAPLVYIVGLFESLKQSTEEESTITNTIGETMGTEKTEENLDEQLEQEDEETLGLLGEPDEEW
ncbi:MAG TPA: hypothetical protein VI864_03670 [Candidatus Bathyarchaeia archaeon]|nr:hypothetical protein [Candidatus Bathyarchaeia archaeon]